MGVVNVTPDSFSDGGQFLDPAIAIAHGQALVADGADILDVGGEATNPRARPVTADEEMARVLPVIRGLVPLGVPLSIDTTKAVVARAAVEAGATIVNDVSGGLFDPDMAATVSALCASGGPAGAVTYVAGHLRGRTLAEVFAAEGAIGWEAVAAELSERVSALSPAARARTWIDPGVGFGKGSDPEGNLALLRHVGDVSAAVGCPVVVGPSRKRFLRRLLDEDRRQLGGSQDDASARADAPLELDVASVAACLAAVRAGASVVRIHNVALLRAALAVYTRS